MEEGIEGQNNPLNLQPVTKPKSENPVEEKYYHGVGVSDSELGPRQEDLRSQPESNKRVSTDSLEKKQGIKAFFKYEIRYLGKIVRIQSEEELVKFFYESFYNNSYNSDGNQQGESSNPKSTTSKLLQIVRALFRGNRMKGNNESQISGNQYGLQSNQESRESKQVQTKYWDVVFIRGGLGDKTNIGRFYLNVKPNYVIEVFDILKDELEKSNIGCQIKKAHDLGNPQTRQRTDKFVLYFNPKDQEQILEVIQQLYDSNKEMFDNDVPQFTARVKTKNGDFMSGVGFAEGGKSFGLRIAEILAYAYCRTYCEERKNPDYVVDYSSKFNEAFEEKCEKMNMDPKNPAFYLNTAFDELRRQLSI